MRSIILFLLISIIGFSNSCTDKNALLNFVEIKGNYSHIEDPYERWKAYDLENYSIIQRRSCECLPIGEVRVTILKNSVEYVEICLNRNKTANDVDPYCDDRSLEVAKDFVLTIEEAFALIEEHEETAHSLRVNYHPIYGYPEEIYIDIVERAADEEIHFYFEDLKKLN